MRRRWLVLFFLAFVTVSLSPVTNAQVTTTGSITVVVEDAQGGRLPGVTVSARAADTVTTRSTVTNAEGTAALEALAPSAQYVVTAELAGFQTRTIENVLVRSGQVATVNAQLGVAGVTEAVTVSASAAPVIDVTNATIGQDITLTLTESLPTGRSYQSYLQLVPGVMPDDPVQSGNPASKSGLNYSDIRGEMGISADNVFFFDGINVTDPVTGTFGANLNTEIIQEQNVITGGITAEFVGTPGLISNVVTKSGSNAFSGSVNYFFQNSSLVAENENAANEEFSTKDNAYTFGGPLVRDRAWFFGSYRYSNRQDDVVTLDTREFMRTVDNTQHQGFAKVTWSPSNADLLSFTYLSDPTEISGRRQTDITNARDRSREQGGHRYGVTYNRVFQNALVDLGFNKHNGEVSDFSVIRESANEILFRGTDTRTLADEQLGGFGRDLIDQRDNLNFRGSLQYTWNRHEFKGGFDWNKHENFRDTLYQNSALFESVAVRHGAVTAADVAGSNWNRLAFDHSNPSDFNGFIDTVNASSNRAAYYAAFDTNGDGTISQTELGESLIFNSTAGNPNSQINYDRTFQASTGAQETSSRGLSFFVQDQFTVGDRLTFNLGLRTERWEHFATTGENIFTFDWAVAPRLSAVYDVTGRGTQKASVYFGRYYDPIRNNMTNFAGTLTGSVHEEQVYALGNWVTYRTRGGATVQDAFFAPTTKTPYTDDFQLGYEIDLGRGMSFGSIYTKRWTRDILEDYDLHLYADEAGYGGPINHPDSLYLGLDYFGYSENPGSNFVIGTLAGGERNYQGLEFVFRKRFSNNWQFLTSYNWNDAEGNTNSDSNADFQGDVLFLDPRAPNQYGTQPGLVSHLFKGAGSYRFDFGLQLGMTFNWNSGTHASRTFLASSRNLPIRVSTADAFDFAGITTRWIAPNTVGVLENPSYGTVDLRVQYDRQIGGATAEAFIDVFNLANNQTGIRNQDLVAGQGTLVFGQPIQWMTPRRAFVGVRRRF
ncbi:MAG: carboxypeptidase regulatory-like domain-containing protein [Vicinamibacterales bacterium]